MKQYGIKEDYTEILYIRDINIQDTLETISYLSETLDQNMKLDQLSGSYQMNYEIPTEIWHSRRISKSSNYARKSEKQHRMHIG